MFAASHSYNFQPNSTFGYVQDYYRVQKSPLPLILVLTMTAMWLTCLFSTWLVLQVMTIRLQHSKSMIHDVLHIVEITADFISVTIYTVQIYTRQGFGIDLEISHIIFCKSLKAMYWLCYGVSTDIIVMFSFLRYVAVYHPFVFQRFVSDQMAMLYLVIKTSTTLTAALMFPIVKHEFIIYSDWFLVQMCSFKTKSKKNIIGHLPDIVNGVLHLILPGLFTILLVIFGYAKKSSRNLFSRHKKKLSHNAVLAQYNNIMIALCLLPGLPVFGFYIYQFWSTNSVQLIHTVLDFAMLLTLLPRCANYLILHYFSSTFRECSMSIKLTRSISSLNKNRTCSSYLKKENNEEFIKPNSEISVTDTLGQTATYSVNLEMETSSVSRKDNDIRSFSKYQSSRLLAYKTYFTDESEEEELAEEN